MIGIRDETMKDISHKQSKTRVKRVCSVGMYHILFFSSPPQCRISFKTLQSTDNYTSGNIYEITLIEELLLQ